MSAAVRLLDPSGERYSAVTPEADNSEYGAAAARTGQSLVRFRVGKLTPTKVGLFVAVWRRAVDGSTEPFPAEDDTETLVIIVSEGSRLGHFVFPKSALVTHGIVSVDGRGGKRGFRVYPPWSATANRQAKQSQQWQCEYFVDVGCELPEREVSGFE
ncbi:MepB family protein [Paenarthrobacter sp. NPDC092416]|uniref:MepB family protein n=1 Tax=Paenarthrobacter sp. NPDC092416 TaxID=3364386 RepID=UPI00380D14BE